jgi:hypothetical protein
MNSIRRPGLPVTSHVRRRPQSQVASSRMANNGDAIEVKVDAVSDEAREMADARDRIVEGARPSSSGHSQATVFQIPDGETTTREVLSDGCHLIPTKWHSPETSVQKADHRWSRTSR